MPVYLLHLQACIGVQLCEAGPDNRLESIKTEGWLDVYIQCSRISKKRTDFVQEGAKNNEFEKRIDFVPEGQKYNDFWKKTDYVQEGHENNDFREKNSFVPEGLKFFDSWKKHNFVPEGPENNDFWKKITYFVPEGPKNNDLKKELILSQRATKTLISKKRTYFVLTKRAFFAIS